MLGKPIQLGLSHCARWLHDGREQDDGMAVARDHDLLAFEGPVDQLRKPFLASATLWLLTFEIWPSDTCLQVGAIGPTPPASCSQTDKRRGHKRQRAWLGHDCSSKLDR
jgi:hypothetical protein